MARNLKKEKPLSERDLMKLQIIDELGLDDKLREVGWDGLSAADCGRVGGILARRLRQTRLENRG